jgi:PASTA domain
MRWRGVSLAGALLVAALFAGRAEGGTAQVVGGTIQFRAQAGEQNHVVFKYVGPADFINVEDTGAPLTAGAGCSAVSANEVRCVGDIFQTPLDADLGDGDDYASNRATIDASRRSGTGQLGSQFVGTRSADEDHPPPPPPPPPRPVRCLVPRVVGMPLSKAKRRLRAAHCRAGAVRTVRASRRKGIVVRQSPRPRTRLRNGGKVKLTVSRGRRG